MQLCECHCRGGRRQSGRSNRLFVVVRGGGVYLWENLRSCLLLAVMPSVGHIKLPVEARLAEGNWIQLKSAHLNTITECVSSSHPPNSFLILGIFHLFVYFHLLVTYWPLVLHSHCQI